MEARVEEQLAEFDTEREQLRSRLKKEEAHCCQLQQQVRALQSVWTTHFHVTLAQERKGNLNEFLFFF